MDTSWTRLTHKTAEHLVSMISTFRSARIEPKILQCRPWPPLDSSSMFGSNTHEPERNKNTKKRQGRISGLAQRIPGDSAQEIQVVAYMIRASTFEYGPTYGNEIGDFLVFKYMFRGVSGF